MGRSEPYQALELLCRMFCLNLPMEIPKIFTQETVTIVRSALIRDPVGVRANRSRLKRTNPREAPDSSG